MSSLLSLPSFSVGKLSKLISIQEEIPHNDSFGGYSLSWATIATVWANISPLHGREVLASDTLQSIISYRIIIRYNSDFNVSNNMRILYGSRIFNIRSVAVADEENNFLIIIADEGGAV